MGRKKNPLRFVLAVAVVMIVAALANGALAPLAPAKTMSTVTGDGESSVTVVFPGTVALNEGFTTAATLTTQGHSQTLDVRAYPPGDTCPGGDGTDLLPPFSIDSFRSSTRSARASLDRYGVWTACAVLDDFNIPTSSGYVTDTINVTVECTRATRLVRRARAKLSQAKRKQRHARTPSAKARARRLIERRRRELADAKRTAPTRIAAACPA